MLIWVEVQAETIQGRGDSELGRVTVSSEGQDSSKAEESERVHVSWEKVQRKETCLFLRCTEDSEWFFDD